MTKVGGRIRVLVMEGHGVESIQLLTVQLLPQPRSSVAEPHLDASLRQFGFLRQLLTQIHIWVLGPLKRPLQLL